MALGELHPAAFERLCQRLLREAGSTRVEVTGKTEDGGIDGTGVLQMNLLSFQVILQCKRWKGSVGASTVRDFRGAMGGRADKGLILTIGAFTADARREATRDGAPAVDLVDGDALCDLLKTYGIEVKVRTVEEVTLDERALAGFWRHRQIDWSSGPFSPISTDLSLWIHRCSASWTSCVEAVEPATFKTVTKSSADSRLFNFAASPPWPRAVPTGPRSRPRPWPSRRTARGSAGA